MRWLLLGAVRVLLIPRRVWFEIRDFWRYDPARMRRQSDAYNERYYRDK
ncbi:MAG: hypothetical protein KGI03_04560 [Patescibacteria group bacterium]|nr:hypothetical protein [Patescibacteria group bacterium]